MSDGTQAGVGDLNSQAKGTGARFNSGKIPLDLIPLRLIAEAYARRNRINVSEPNYAFCMNAMGEFQEGDDEALWDALLFLGPLEQTLDHVAKVLAFGKQKYAAWNWAKGMAWSHCIGCTGRHLRDLLEGQDKDKESGEHLIGHVGCNIVFLLTYLRNYREGDDRPSKNLFEAG